MPTYVPSQHDKHTLMGTVIKEFQDKGELKAMEREVMSLGFGAYTGMDYHTDSELRSLAHF